jgi:hypothetical protein
MNTLKLIRTLDEYLAEYESLCSQKEVEQSRMGRAASSALIASELCGAMPLLIHLTCYH